MCFLEKYVKVICDQDLVIDLVWLDYTTRSLAWRYIYGNARPVDIYGGVTATTRLPVKGRVVCPVLRGADWDGQIAG